MRARRVLVVAACAGAAMTALAQTPPAAPAAPAGPAAPAATSVPSAPVPPPAPVLGRLFFTPEARARLDELRRRPPEPKVVARPEEPPPPVPEYVTVDGVVRRSDGASTVWINREPVYGSRAESGIVVTPSRGATPADVTVQLPQIGRSVRLKVGQQLEVNSGEVKEAYHAPRAAAAQPANETGAGPRETAPQPAAGRANRQRDLLQELLEEIEGPKAGSARAPGASSATR